MNKMLTIIIVAIVVVAGIGAALYFLMQDSDDSEKIFYTTVSPPLMRIALEGGEVDGYIAWEPYCSDSIVEGTGHALLWSGEIRDAHPCCVLLVSDDFLESENGPEITARFLRAHIEATDWMNEALTEKQSDNYSALLDMAVNFTGRDRDVVASAFDHIRFDYSISEDFYDALEWFTESFIDIGVIDEDAMPYDNATEFVHSYVDETPLSEAPDVLPTEEMVGIVRLGFLTGDLHQMAQYVARNATVFGTSSLFEKYGVQIQQALGAPYSNGPTEMDNFAQGNVDIGYLGAPPAILKHVNNPNVQGKIIAQANTEGSALIVREGIESLEDLKSKLIAVPGTGTIQYLLLQVLIRDAGMELKAA